MRLALSAQGRLEVHEADSRIAWFALDARGEPYAFGAHGDEVGNLSGPFDLRLARAFAGRCAQSAARRHNTFNFSLKLRPFRPISRYTRFG